MTIETIGQAPNSVPFPSCNLHRAGGNVSHDGHPGWIAETIAVRQIVSLHHVADFEPAQA